VAYVCVEMFVLFSPVRDVAIDHDDD
jgi:hypothetical protein